MNTLIKTGAVLCAALSLSAPMLAYGADVVMPKPRIVDASEQKDLTRMVSMRLQQTLPVDAQFAAAGAFRFVSTRDYRYFDRTDTGGVAVEYPKYGVRDKPLDPKLISADVMVPQALKALANAGLDIDGLSFASFYDEYCGTGQPGLLPRDFDPRKNSMLVARSVAFERRLKGVPVFGSEVVVGLLDDGSIGRLRYHAPKVDDVMLRDGATLAEMVAVGKWQLPEALRAADIKVLAMDGGVGHSGFASPEPRMAPVVRVLSRRFGSDKEAPLQSTRYQYFDAKGNEVMLDAFPDVAATPATYKKN